jgi:uncharacterized protein (DUF4415 family)
MKANSERKAKASSTRKTFEVEITESDHRQMISEGADPQYALKQGLHTFRRGGFRERHPDLDLKKAERKIRVNIMLDGDIVRHFKGLAAKPNAAPYQRQINNALRAYIEQRTDSPVDYSSLLDDERFIRAVAERVKAHG